MCGFVGVIGPSARILSARLDSALTEIQHRGPDARGTWQSDTGDCALGHVRLSILDLSDAANQPMWRGGDCLVYNGEVYNHLERRNDLNVHFETHSDTETLLEGFRRSGKAELSKLRGMFSGFYFDGAKNRGFLFRDDRGVKPLYYLQIADSTIVFASEAKGIWTLLSDRKRTVDLGTLQSYLHFENWAQGGSLFGDLRQLRPGETIELSVESGKVHVRAEGRSPVVAGGGDAEWLDEGALEERTMGVIEDSVSKHLLSDVPLGVYLSGGTDSSLVAAIAARNASDLMAFTGYFETKDSFYDERTVSRDVARSLGIQMHEVLISPSDFKRVFDKVIWHLDEPRMGMGSFSQFVVAEEAAKHRKVILAGHGGDENFAGYPQFKAFCLLQEGLFSRKGIGVMRQTNPKELPWIAYLLGKRWLGMGTSFAPKLLDRPIGAESSEGIESAFYLPEQMRKQALNALVAYYHEVYLPGLLVVEDKISMAHSLETRVPLCDREVMKLAASIPIELKLRGGRLKGFLKDAASKYLPQSVLKAPKRGFPTPLRFWFKDELGAFVEERLLDSPSAAFYELFDRSLLEKVVRGRGAASVFFAMDEVHAHQVWMLLCMESWLRQYNVGLR